MSDLEYMRTLLPRISLLEYLGKVLKIRWLHQACVRLFLRRVENMVLDGENFFLLTMSGKQHQKSVASLHVKFHL
jgi:hypothetical protein